MKGNIKTNVDIEQDVLEKLLEHCFCQNTNETKTYSVLNDVYRVVFKLKRNVLMESINEVGFGMHEGPIPSCSYAKVNEVQKEEYKTYKDLSESNEPITLCCLNKSNCLYSYQDNLKQVKQQMSNCLKVESSVVLTTGGNFSSFHIDTYGTSRISIIPEWNLGLSKIWIFYCHKNIKMKNHFFSYIIY